MARYRQDFTLFPRQLSGKKVWYFRTYSPDGQRSVPRSTGVLCDDSTPSRKNTSKEKAVRFCNALIASGKLYQASCIRFEVYAATWFTPKSEWVMDRMAAGVPGRPALSASYLKSLQMCLRLYLVPYFGSKSLEAIKPSTIKSFRVWLQSEKDLSNTTINIACDTLRIMTDWMLADGLLLLDPFRSVKRFAVEKRTRRGFTIEETKTIFSATWPANLPQLFNLVAAITGMRLSEIRAIRSETLFSGYIDVKDQYLNGLSVLKTQEARKVPIPAGLYELLLPLVKKPFVFALPKAATPMSRNAVIEPFDKVLEAVKVSKTEGLCFHSWRHSANTWLLAEGVEPHKVRAIMGHSEGKGTMTATYTDWKPEMFPEVYAAQEKLFELLNPS